MRSALWFVLAIAVLGVLGGILDVLSTFFLSLVGPEKAEAEGAFAQSIVYLVTAVIHLFVIGGIFLWVRRHEKKYLLFSAYSLIGNMMFDFMSLAIPEGVQDARNEGVPEWLFRAGPIFEFVPPGIGSGLLALIFLYVEREYQKRPLS